MQAHKFKSKNGIPVIFTKAPDDRSKRGIHLADPTENELENATERAESQGFPCVYIHLVDCAGVA